jgi:hypothetical protein
MKKLMIVCSTLLVAAGVSCNKSFLDVKPKSFLSASGYFQGADHLSEALNGVYNPLDGLYTGSMWALAEMRSDNTSYQYNTGDRSGFPQEELDEFREVDDNSFVYSFYQTSYTGIARANVLLDNLQNNTSVPDSLKNLLKGQAEFLRAFYYFNLVRLIGDVPLVLHEVTSTDESFSQAARKKPEDIYPVIITDLKDAIQLLPVRYSQPTDIGRATKGAAETFLGKVYMTQKNFSEAIPLLEDVRKLGYSLLPNYADIFNPANKNNQESIFEIQYKEGSPGTPSNFIYTFAPYNAGTSITGFQLYSGAGSGWNIPTRDLVNAYEPGDKRKAASIDFGFTDPNSGQVVPYILKYDHPPYQLPYETSDDFIVTRYADVLLLLAECLNQKGFVAGGEAFQLLNQVRERAGLPDKTADNANAALRVPSQNAFTQAVLRERRVELAFEDHRWFDLLRTGSAASVMKAHGVEEKQLKPYVASDAYTNIPLTYQYPRREMQLLK